MAKLGKDISLAAGRLADDRFWRATDTQNPAIAGLVAPKMPLL